LRDMGKTTLISSHILTEMGDMCNKIGIIERGALRAAGDYREILKQIRHAREIRVMVLDGGDVAARILAETPGVDNISRSGNEFQFETNIGHSELGELHDRLFRGGARVLFFQEEEGTLEDVFLHVTSGGI
jgi:ABC-2 type transport system ATP-binding protein